MQEDKGCIAVAGVVSADTGADSYGGVGAVGCSGGATANVGGGICANCTAAWDNVTFCTAGPLV